MSKKNEPTFPVTEMIFDSRARVSHGLAKREWFAGMAMQGMLMGAKLSVSECHFLVKQAIATADALLAELEKSNGT